MLGLTPFDAYSELHSNHSADPHYISLMATFQCTNN